MQIAMRRYITEIQSIHFSFLFILFNRLRPCWGTVLKVVEEEIDHTIYFLSLLLIPPVPYAGTVSPPCYDSAKLNTSQNIVGDHQ